MTQAMQPNAAPKFDEVNVPGGNVDWLYSICFRLGIDEIFYSDSELMNRKIRSPGDSQIARLFVIISS
jgi:hypothetical protein